MSAVPLPEPAAWRSQSPVGGYHFSETRPTGAIEKYPQTPLVTLEDAIVYGAACAAEAVESAWLAVNAIIKQGPLQGSGCDDQAQRNGIILAANLLQERLAAIRGTKP